MSSMDRNTGRIEYICEAYVPAMGIRMRDAGCVKSIICSMELHMYIGEAGVRGSEHGTYGRCNIHSWDVGLYIERD